MLTLETTAQFRKDYKRAKCRGYRMELLEVVIQSLIEERTLDARYKDHALSGALAAYKECHVLPDWLLMYRIDKQQLILTTARTGTHADLFNE